VGSGETFGRVDSDVQDASFDVVATHFHDGSFDVDKLGPGSPAAQASMESDSASGTKLRLTNSEGNQVASSTADVHRRTGS